MGKAVLLHRVDSIYEDEPDVKYDFPRSYLKTMSRAVGDWVLYYEPVKAGARGYFAVAKVDRIVPKRGEEGRYLALIERGSFLPFDREVPRLIDGRPLEASLADEMGLPKKGGAQQLAVRDLSEDDFARIINLGLPEQLEDIEAQRYSSLRSEIDDAQAPFQRPVVERLTRRPYRDVAFRRKVRDAYGYRCAISGLHLRNGGGRPEVQAAHIRPVEEGGSDSVRNGLALSGTLHWMFDRGLISIDPEEHRILVSHNKVPGEVVQRLILPSQRLTLPDDRRNWPHPDNLRWHRENIFGQSNMESFEDF
ncbi:HNH endonuclease [Salipiger bermudensis]|uniref:HNH endonuclease n=1 Tax=Salipiger bermudensis TaxID=344736 RepID=UPI001CD693BB|nr:HNH endonuclease [Salipiger bermudensis]MCA1285468.1 HNH endonuclease [Salipiger bermudensis]